MGWLDTDIHDPRAGSGSELGAAAIQGGRRCPEDQPQRVDDPIGLRLVLRTLPRSQDPGGLAPSTTLDQAIRALSALITVTGEADWTDRAHWL